MKLILLISGLLLALSASLKAQVLIKGKVVDEYSQQLSGATITVSNHADEFIIGFAFSDQGGEYELQVSASSDSLLVTVSFLGYKPIDILIPNNDQEIDFYLKDQPFQIEEVIVKALIEQSGDTIMYSVPMFMREQDRVIGDVLRRLPGIDVLNDGRVLYQGKPIQKYYIEGLDLLGGRYNMANNNLPAGSVSQVQIIENHQPIRILDSLVFSDRASLNIKLKRNIAWAGTAQLGSGIEPMLWDVAATPMMFGRNQQMISSYQGNNVGDNIARELNMLTIEELLIKQHTSSEKTDWVQILALPKPGLSEQTWLNNSSHLGSANYLFRLKNDFELKTNISYLHHLHKQRGESSSQLFTLTDTIMFFQSVNNEQLDHSFGSKFTLTRNIPRNYLVNELELNSHWDRKTGFVRENTSDIQQRLKSPLSSVNNRLTTMLPMGNQIVTLRSFLTYTHTNQSLNVHPAPFRIILTPDNPIAALQQDVSQTGFFTNNLLSFTKRIKGFSITPQVGFLFHHIKLDSKLWNVYNDEIVSMGAGFDNHLGFISRAAHASLKGQYRYKGWRMEARGRLSVNYFVVDNHINNPGTRVDFEPTFLIHKELNPRWNISSEYSNQNIYGSVEHLYDGFVLANYRLLQRNTPTFPEQKMHSFRVAGNYRNIPGARFFNLAYGYSNVNNNLIFSHELDPDGFIMIQSYEKPSVQHIHNVSLRFSQYFRSLKTNMAFSPNYMFVNHEAVLNDDFTAIRLHNYTFNIRFETAIFSWWEVLYTPTISMGVTEIEYLQNLNVQNWSHKFEMNFYPVKQHNINIETENYQSNIHNNRNNTFLLNTSYKYKVPRQKLELYLAWNNVLNTRNYHVVRNSLYSLVSRSYALRPSELHFGLSITF